MSRVISVHAPSRIHLGMFSLGGTNRPAYGGVGFMVDPAAVRLTIRDAESVSVAGPLADRVKQILHRLTEVWPAVPTCAIHVECAPPAHAGLGTGTQLALSVAAGLRRLAGLQDFDATHLAESTGRGLRSAVGTHGFLHGGLIVDGGQLPGQQLGQLLARREVPTDWRIVLIRRSDAAGLAGDDESRAFNRLPPVPPGVIDELLRITNQEMLPALERADCLSFGDSVYRFGRLAGSCFAAVQGGPYADAATERLVEDIRQFDVPGVGQSSWGPTVYAIMRGDDAAPKLVDWLKSRQDSSGYEIEVARPNNTGATLMESCD